MGLRALSLWTLGVRRRSLVLGTGIGKHNTDLFAGTGCVCAIQRKRRGLGATWSRRRLRAALLQHELATLLLNT